MSFYFSSTFIIAIVEQLAFHKAMVYRKQKRNSNPRGIDCIKLANANKHWLVKLDKNYH